MIRKGGLIVWSAILLSFIVSVYFYPQMPDVMAVHWNARGQVDGYMSKFRALFLTPFILLGVGSLFILIPKIDPLKDNIEKSKKYYDGFFELFALFLLAVHIWMIMWNAGLKVSPNVVFPIGFGILYFFIGILIENVKRNWFIGIRTPWTLSSDEVWDKTHRIGGKLLKIAGAIVLMGALFPNQAFLFVIIPVIAVAFYTVLYSYIEYRKMYSS